MRLVFLTVNIISVLVLTRKRRINEGVLDRNSVFGEKNDEFSFSVKLMPKLVRLGHVGFMLANVIVLNKVFSFKISNAAITNCGL